MITLRALILLSTAQYRTKKNTKQQRQEYDLTCYSVQTKPYAVQKRETKQALNVAVLHLCKSPAKYISSDNEIVLQNNTTSYFR